MMKRIFILTLAALLAVCCFAQESLRKGRFEPHRNVVSDGYNFWTYTPGDYEPEHPTPLVLFLHGASLCGTDLNKVRRYGTLDALEKGKIVPAFVLAPQNPGGAWSPQRLWRLVEWMQRTYNIDSTRIYVLGMSLGGYGTLDFAAAYPERIAAAMALCGGCSSSAPDGLGRLPLWIIHGTSDRAVPISASKQVVSYLEAHGQTELLRYDWKQGWDHGRPARLFYLQKTYDWLFSHSTTDRPRFVDRGFEITEEDVKQTYQELKWFQGMFEDD